MARDPLFICREYLRSSSSETRGKTVAALAATAATLDLETAAASAAELARLALAEPSEDVRKRAEKALTSLDERPRSTAVQWLLEALAEPTRRLRAHTLLARLRNQGVATGTAPRPEPRGRP